MNTKSLAVAVMLFASSVGLAKTKQNILWVVDNSASMDRIRKTVVATFSDFLGVLEANDIDYKMAITTTDVFSHSGALVTDGAISRVESCSPSPTIDFEILMRAVDDSGTSFWEQGLEASRIALRGQGSFLVEADVPLSVIYVSDENDYSCKDQCWGVEPENNKNYVPFEVERYKKFFSNLALRTSSVKIYPVVGTQDSPCSIASPGLRYEELQQAIGGHASSVCPQLVRESILSIAESIIR